MTTPAELVATSPEAVPTLIGATFRLVAALAVILGAFGVWVWWSRRAKSGRRRIELLDRAFVSRGVSVALVRVDGEHMVLGVSPDGVRMLRRMDGVPVEAEEDDAPRKRFTEILAERMSGQRGG